jgi:hypothetical protein
VDFAILKDGKLEELIEVKYSDPKISPSLQYYTEKLSPPKSTQIVAQIKRPYDAGRISVNSPIEALIRI